VKCWEELPQWRIQAWIKRIVEHIKQVILLEGGALKGAIEAESSLKQSFKIK
jgi:hypothetical protein